MERLEIEIRVLLFLFRGVLIDEDRVRAQDLVAGIGRLQEHVEGLLEIDVPGADADIEIVGVLVEHKIQIVGLADRLQHLFELCVAKIDGDRILRAEGREHIALVLALLQAVEIGELLFQALIMAIETRRSLIERFGEIVIADGLRTLPFAVEAGQFLAAGRRLPRLLQFGVRRLGEKPHFEFLDRFLIAPLAGERGPRDKKMGRRLGLATAQLVKTRLVA